MKRLWIFLLVTIPVVTYAQDTTLVFNGPRLRLNTLALLPPPPVITWLRASPFFTTVQLFACISNLTSLESIRFYRNGEEQTLDPKDFSTQYSECPNAYFFLHLTEVTTAETTFKLEARNIGGADTAYFTVKFPNP